MRNLISFNYSEYEFSEEDYKTKLRGTSDCNSYMPFFGVFAHTRYEFKKNQNVYEWSLPTVPSLNRRERQYSRLNITLRRGGSPKNYIYKIRGEEYTIQIHRGVIYSGNTILMCLGVNPNYIFNSSLANLQASPADSNEFSLFINNEFESNPIYKNIYKKVSLLYIKELREKGVDVVYTSRINSWLFKNNFVKPKFKKVTDMMKHLKEEVPKILLTE